MYLVLKLSQLSIAETVVNPDCLFTLLELVVVAVSKAELMSSTASAAVVAVLAFSVAFSCFSLASLIFSLASSILSVGLDAAEIRWGVKPCGDVVMTKVVDSAAVEEVKAREEEGAGAVGNRVGVEIRWGVKPCGDVAMTKVVVSDSVEEVKAREAGVIGDGSSVGVSNKLDVGASLVVAGDGEMRWGVKPCGDVVVVLTVGVLDGFVNFVVLLPDIVDIR